MCTGHQVIIRKSCKNQWNITNYNMTFHDVIAAHKTLFHEIIWLRMCAFKSSRAVFCIVAAHPPIRQTLSNLRSRCIPLTFFTVFSACCRLQSVSLRVCAASAFPAVETHDDSSIRTRRRPPNTTHVMVSVFPLRVH